MSVIFTESVDRVFSKEAVEEDSAYGRISLRRDIVMACNEKNAPSRAKRSPLWPKDKQRGSFRACEAGKVGWTST